jgi:hypothetical protein
MCPIPKKFIIFEWPLTLLAALAAPSANFTQHPNFHRVWPTGRGGTEAGKSCENQTWSLVLSKFDKKEGTCPAVSGFQASVV